MKCEKNALKSFSARSAYSNSYQVNWMLLTYIIAIYWPKENSVRWSEWNLRGVKISLVVHLNLTNTVKDQALPLNRRVSHFAQHSTSRHFISSLTLLFLNILEFIALPVVAKIDRKQTFILAKYHLLERSWRKKYNLNHIHIITYYRFFHLFLYLLFLLCREFFILYASRNFSKRWHHSLLTCNLYVWESWSLR